MYVVFLFFMFFFWEGAENSNFPKSNFNNTYEYKCIAETIMAYLVAALKIALLLNKMKRKKSIWNKPQEPLSKNKFYFSWKLKHFLMFFFLFS